MRPKKGSWQRFLPIVLFLLLFTCVYPIFITTEMQAFQEQKGSATPSIETEEPKDSSMDSEKSPLRDSQVREGGQEGAWRRLDKTLSASLAATLAGLALAAAAFLMSLIPKAERETIDSRSFTRVDRIHSAIKTLLVSFFLFVLVLLESLTLDVVAEFANPWNLLSFLDSVLAGGGMLFGIFFMVCGAVHVFIAVGSGNKHT